MVDGGRRERGSEGGCLDQPGLSAQPLISPPGLDPAATRPDVQAHAVCLQGGAAGSSLGEKTCTWGW